VVSTAAHVSWVHGSPDAAPDERRIRVGGNQSYAPYEWLDEKGRPHGFNIDLMRAIGEIMGVSVEFKLGPWKQARQDLDAGRIDVLPRYRPAERQALADFSEPYTIVYYEVYARRNATPVRRLKDLRGREIIVQSDSLIHEHLRDTSPDFRLVPVDSEPDALRLLASGKHDYALVSQIGGLQAIKRYKLSNLTVMGPPMLPRGYALAVAQGNAALLNQINQALAILKATGRYSEIYDRWFGRLLGRDQLSFMMLLSYAVWALIPLTAMAIGVLIWSASLKRQVAQRTRALHQELMERRLAEQALRESEDRLKDVTEAASDWIWEMDEDLRFTFLSPRFYQLTQIAPEQILGRTRWEVAGSDARHGKWRQHRELLSEHLPFRDFVYKTGVADGQGHGHYFNISGKPVFDAQGRFKGFRGTGSDITAKVEAEIALGESQRALATLMDNLPGMAYRRSNNPHGTMEFVSSGCYELTGYHPEDVIADRKIAYWEIIHPEERARIRDEIQRALQETRPFQLTYRIQTAKGEMKWAWEQGCGVFAADGELQAVEGLVMDITERQRAEQALQASEEQLRQIIDLVPHMIFAKNRRGELLLVNKAVADNYGTTVEALVDRRHRSVHRVEDEVARMLADDAEVIDSGRPKFIPEEEFTDYRGRLRILQTTKIPLAVPGISELALLGVAIDITEQKRAQEERTRMRLYLKNIIDSMPSVLIGVDNEGRITEWNQAAEKLSGTSWERAQGRFFSAVCPRLAHQWQQAQRSISQGRPLKTQRIATEMEGRMRYEDIMIYPLIAEGAIGAVIRVDDVTARVRIEEMMVQTEKMLSIGGLAAGMAHEINNPLGTVIQGTQNILRRISVELSKNRNVAEALGLDLALVGRYLEEREILRFLDDIHEAGTRAAKIVTDMLSFSRHGELRFTPVNVDELLDTVVRLASSDYDLKKKHDFKQIRVIKECDPTLTQIVCDKTEIEQVILNLIKNAAQAMAAAATPAPTITLRTRRELNYACIEVGDNGPGMEEQVRKRVFEPFFTTKEVGLGTGLGLSVSFFIITDQHKGMLSVTSKPGAGTRFSIRLPLEKQVAVAKGDASPHG
jgi:PAS domain S-box-containing protein